MANRNKAVKASSAVLSATDKKELQNFLKDNLPRIVDKDPERVYFACNITEADSVYLVPFLGIQVILTVEDNKTGEVEESQNYLNSIKPSDPDGRLFNPEKPYFYTLGAIAPKSKRVTSIRLA